MGALLKSISFMSIVNQFRLGNFIEHCCVVLSCLCDSINIMLQY